MFFDMAADDTHKPKPDVRSDDDWKQRVKAEDAARDQEFQHEKQEASEPNREESSSGTQSEERRESESTSSPEAAGAKQAGSQPLPPPDFNTLVSMFSTQAMVALGVIPNPATGQSESHPELAQHFIDMLSVLEEKTQGNLDRNEAALLTSTLHQLRMAYVEITKETKAE